jgi:hypothetical protein
MMQGLGISKSPQLSNLRQYDHRRVRPYSRNILEPLGPLIATRHFLQPPVLPLNVLAYRNPL